ncbi:MAG: hypothetical protein QMD80_04330 [archaeon]|nr:hypothetical protein [archaeon]
MGKAIIPYPYIPISRIEFVKDNDDDFFACVTDPWEIWEYINELKRNFRDLIQIFFEEVDQSFVIVVHWMEV